MSFENRFNSLAEFARVNGLIASQEAAKVYARELDAHIAKDKKRQQAEREAALPIELRETMRTSDAAFITRGRDLLEWHARKHDIAVTYVARNDPQEGRAGIHGIRLPVPMCVESVLTFAHELGHRLAPPCPGSAPHLRVQHDRHTACIVCEVNAWTKAFELIPFTEAMARSAADSLRSHLRSTPATDEAKRRVECFMRLEQWRHQQDLDEFARLTRELEAEGVLPRKGQHYGRNK